jgi:hypothetical protein
LVDIHVHKAKVIDCIRLARDLRPEDVVEMQAAFPGVDYADVLKYQIECDETSLSVYFGGDIAAIYGCKATQADPSVGVPWMMGSKILRKHPRLVIEASSHLLYEWLQEFERLENMVSEKATANIRFLRALGFEVSSPQDGYCLFSLEGVDVF